MIIIIFMTKNDIAVKTSTNNILLSVSLSLRIPLSKAKPRIANITAGKNIGTGISSFRSLSAIAPSAIKTKATKGTK